MPVGTLEVEVKVKTTWGMFSMVQDICTRMETYHTWEKPDGRSTIKIRKRKAPCKMTTMQTKDNTSETDVPTGQGFRYPPHVFTDPTYTTIAPKQKRKEEQHKKVNSWAGIVNFVIDVVNHIAGVTLLIGKKTC